MRRTCHRSSGWGRVVAVLVAAIVTVALVAGCGGGAGSSQADLARQDSLVQLGNRLAAIRAKLAATGRQFAAREQRVRLVAQRRRAVAQRGRSAGKVHRPTDAVTATVTDDAGPVVGQLLRFTVHGANAGASGTCSPADCRTDRGGNVTFTYTITHAGDNTITVVCERAARNPKVPKQRITTTPPMTPPMTPPITPPTTPPMTPPHRPKIFQVELRRCKKLHVGYDYFPVGTVVQWNVTRDASVVSSGEFRTLGGEKTYHFLTQPLGVTLPSTPDGAAHFTWVRNGTRFGYSATRAPGC